MAATEAVAPDMKIRATDVGDSPPPPPRGHTCALERCTGRREQVVPDASGQVEGVLMLGASAGEAKTKAWSLKKKKKEHAGSLAEGNIRCGEKAWVWGEKTDGRGRWSLAASVPGEYPCRPLGIC